METVRIEYENGSIQVVKPDSTFDGRFDLLVAQIAEGRKCTYKVLKTK